MGLFEQLFGPRQKKTVKGEHSFEGLTAYKPVFTSWDGRLYENDLLIADPAFPVNSLKLRLRKSYIIFIRQCVYCLKSHIVSCSEIFLFGIPKSRDHIHIAKVLFLF